MLPRNKVDEAVLELFTEDELRDIERAHAELEKRLDEYGPQTPDELHAWILSELGVDIPRTSVCEDHDAPFDFLSDLYFEKVDAVLLLANRSGSKTFLVAVLHWINSKWKPGCESCTFGATEAQSRRAYAHLKKWIYDDDGNLKPEVKNSLMLETNFKNLSLIYILAGTEQAVNGPHPQKAHADEIELMDAGTWKESRNMTISARTPDGRLIKPQDIATSTRKGPHGRMQELIDEIEQAEKEGFKPPRKLYKWCIFESAAPVKNCQIAKPHLPNSLACPCNTIRKGEWDDGRPRILSDVCGGKFFRSGGWQPYGDVVKQFLENDRETFEVQQLCSKPEMSNHYLPTFTEERHCIRDYFPDPRNGPIFQSVDWGTSNPAAVNWYQLIANEVSVKAWIQPKEKNKETFVTLPKYTLICFDEIYIADIGNVKLGNMVFDHEREWQRLIDSIAIDTDFEVYERYSDVQGRGARKDWKGMGLKTSWHATREFEEHIKDVKDIFEDGLFKVAGDRCPMFVKEIQQWRRNPDNGKQVDEFNHCMSNFRYCVSNLKKVRNKALRIAENLPTSSAIPRQTVRIVTDTQETQEPIHFQGRNAENELEAWRKSLGGPVTPNPLNP